MRWSPRDHSTLLGSSEEFFHVPLAPEGIHDSTRAPIVLVGAKYASAEPGLLQLTTQGGIHLPAKRWLLVLSGNGGHDEARQMLPGQCLLASLSEAAAGDAARLGQSLELAQLHLGLAQGHGDAALLSRQQFFTLYHDERAVQLSNRGSHPGRAYVLELAGKRLHRSPTRRHLQCRFRGGVPQRQRDDAVVAGSIQVQLQLGAPEPAVAHQGALRRRRATGTVLERLVQLLQSPQASFQNSLIRAIPRVGPIQERHMSCLADQ